MPIFHDLQEDPPSEAGMSAQKAIHDGQDDGNVQSKASNDPSRPPSRLETQYPFTTLQNPTVAYTTYQAGSGISRGELIQRLKRAQSPVQNVCIKYLFGCCLLHEYLSTLLPRVAIYCHASMTCDVVEQHFHTALFFSSPLVISLA